MGKNNKNSKRQRYSKREEEKANRLFKGICIGLILLALLIFAGYVGIARRALGIEKRVDNGSAERFFSSQRLFLQIG